MKIDELMQAIQNEFTKVKDQIYDENWDEEKKLASLEEFLSTFNCHLKKVINEEKYEIEIGYSGQKIRILI